MPVRNGQKAAPRLRANSKIRTPSPINQHPAHTVAHSQPETFPLGLPRNPRLARLAKQISRLHPPPAGPRTRIPSGFQPLDQALAGGFTSGAIHELLARSGGAAAHTVALCTAIHAAQKQRWIFYIDTGNDFYPPAAARQGIPLHRLLIIRTRRNLDALWTCEQALRCRAVAAVILPLNQLEPQNSRRLQLAAESGNTLGLIIRNNERPNHSFAASRILLENLPGNRDTRRLRITVSKLRDADLPAPFILEFSHATYPLPLSAFTSHPERPAKPHAETG